MAATEGAGTSVPAHRRARPTTYRGIQMRSRLEAEFARWADSNSVPWEYEPRCYAGTTGQYLPDFVTSDGAVIEVKPQGFNDIKGALRKMHVVLESEPGAFLYVFQPLGAWSQGVGYPSFGYTASCAPDEPCGHCERYRSSYKLADCWSGQRMVCPTCRSHHLTIDRDTGGLACRSCLAKFSFDMAEDGSGGVQLNLVVTEGPIPSGPERARAALGALRARADEARANR